MPVEFGATPWGRVWLRAVEPTAVSAPNPALPKGRSLARNSAVTLALEPGRVTGEVSAGKAAQHVRIDLALLSGREREDTERLRDKALAEHRGLAPGDLPDELEGGLRELGIDLAVPVNEQEATCDCRSRQRPCAHILATLYALVQRVDERPALALELRLPGGTEPEPASPDWIPLTELDAAAFYGD